MRAAAARYRELRPHVELSLRTRPLASFNDQPIESLGREFDLVVFDHPMVPRAAEAGALLPLDVLARELDRPLVPASAMIGASQASYVWEGHTWGVAVDAACQVAVARPDLLARLGAPVPATWDEVLALASASPGSVALPLFHSDAFCALISVSVGLASARPTGPSRDWLSLDAVRLLAELARLVDPACFELNPPELLARLSDADRWAYVPLSFGYAGVGRGRLEWHDAPRVEGRSPGSILGGAGLGVTRHAGAPAEALRFALWYASAETQRDVVLPAGGQPAARAVWDDPAADASANGLFSGTRSTIDQAVVRPRAPWWPPFQAEASLQLHRLLRSGAPPARIHAALTGLHADYTNR